MIDIKKLVKEDVGRKVVFVFESGNKCEGRIVSWDDDWIYVRYVSVPHFWNAEKNTIRGLKTLGNNLEFIGPPPNH